MKIGFIGLGIMGEPMCENIIKKHDDIVYVYDVEEEKVQQLAQKGAESCKSAVELAEKSDLIISMVPKSEHVRAVYHQILPVLDKTKVCIDMSTIDPAVSVEVAGQVKEAGAQFLDAPVVKSKPAAVAGKLGIYVGGELQVYEEVKPILSYMGENIIHMGSNGKGLVMKICHNALVSQIQNGVNETLHLAKLNGIDIQEFAKAVSYGGGQNFYLDSKKDVIEKKDYETAFSVENMAKDVGICVNLAKESGFSMPGEANVANVYDKALKQGYGNQDFSVTYEIVGE